MAKIDKKKNKSSDVALGENKDVGKKSKKKKKAHKKLEKQKDTERTVKVAVNPQSISTNTKNFIVCLKHGTKYGAEYVKQTLQYGVTLYCSTSLFALQTTYET